MGTDGLPAYNFIKLDLSSIAFIELSNSQKQEHNTTAR